MKKTVFLSMVVMLACAATSQVLKTGSTVKPVSVSDADENAKTLPLAAKLMIVYYIDPDASSVNEPMAQALKKHNLSKDKYAEIAVVNAKDTWIPNSTIRTGARKNSKPGGLQVWIDEDKRLSTAWGLGDCNNACVVLIIGNDKNVKFVRHIKSKEDSRNATEQFLSVLNAAIASN